MKIAALQNNINQNIKKIQEQFYETPDLVIRNIGIDKNQVECTLLYLESLTDKYTIQEHVLSPLLHCSFYENQEPPVAVGKILKIYSLQDIENALLAGDSVLLVQGRPYGYQLETKGWPQRQPQDTQNELSIKGTQQSLIETSNQNIALIRRYIPQSELIIRERNIAKKQKNKLSILYIKNQIESAILQELEVRITKIHADLLINTGELVEWLEDSPYSPFPQFLLTERPDWIAKHLKDGRIVLILDNTSQALIVPMNFVGFFKSIDDYGSRWYIASFMRVLRFVAFIVSILLPALYVAVISFHFEVIPMRLLFSIADSRAQVPFHPILEVSMMLGSLELMREAAIRLPAPIGLTVGIVSGTIIGQAAVQAGIVSNIMIIVVGVTALASYIIPSYDMGDTVRLLRFPFIILAACFGLIGIIVGWMILVSHIINLESLGTPYGTPFSPIKFSGFKDTFLRVPLKWLHKKRNG
ncbi:spore germination protein [Bacillus cereus]|uniref:spore germination protein n=1 Tax=Bacillus cereus TaxID=1396 RepID=UPI0030130C78